MLRTFLSILFFSTCGAIRIARDLPKDFFNWQLIFPGTKWCGTGDIAKNDTDFGTFLNVDRCCQAHDKCPDYISGFQTKYNLTNPVFHTRLHCSCDMEFYNCLKKINTPIALKVGLIFFNLLNNQCYKEDYPYKCISRLIIPPRCIEREFDITKKPVYQWFDLPLY